jgi:hypothetical protein
MAVPLTHNSGQVYGYRCRDSGAYGDALQQGAGLGSADVFGSHSGSNEARGQVLDPRDA